MRSHMQVLNQGNRPKESDQNCDPFKAATLSQNTIHRKQYIKCLPIVFSNRRIRFSCCSHVSPFPASTTMGSTPSITHSLIWHTSFTSITSHANARRGTHQHNVPFTSSLHKKRIWHTNLQHENLLGTLILQQQHAHTTMTCAAGQGRACTSITYPSLNCYIHNSLRTQT